MERVQVDLFGGGRRGARRWGALAAALLLFSTGACGIVPWKYKAGLRRGELGDLAPLQAAIRPVIDGRQSIKLNNAKIFLLYIPLLPYVTTEIEQRDEDIPPNAPVRLEMKDVAGWALDDELRASRAFAAAHYRPLFSEDYDVFFQPTIKSTRTQFAMTSYMLGMAGVLFWLFPLPLGKLHANYEQELAALDVAGQPIAVSTAHARESWTVSLYYGMWPVTIYEKMRAMIQKVNRQALSELLPKVKEHFAGDPEHLEKARRLRYAEALDPDLVKFREALQGKGSPVGASQRQRLRKAYQEKRELLEALRLVEIDLAEQADRAGRKAYDEHQEQMARAMQQQVNQAISQGAAAAAGAAGSSGLGGGKSWGQMGNIERGFAVAQQVSNLSNALQAADAEGASASRQALARAMANPRLDAFRNIQGNRHEIREKWMDRYRSETDLFKEVLRGPPAPAAPAVPVVELKSDQGAVQIESDPAGAEIFVNGQFYGMTPSAPLKFPAGTPMEIKIVKSGYADFVRKMQLPPGNTLRIAAQLEKAAP